MNEAIRLLLFPSLGIAQETLMNGLHNLRVCSFRYKRFSDELSRSKQMYFSRIGLETERFCQLLGDSYFFSAQFGRYSRLMEELVQLLLYSVLVVYISINDKYFREWGKALFRYQIG